jgi:hypothetical protein
MSIGKLLEGFNSRVDGGKWDFKLLGKHLGKYGVFSGVIISDF